MPAKTTVSMVVFRNLIPWGGRAEAARTCLWGGERAYSTGMKAVFSQLKDAWNRRAVLRWAAGLAAGWFVLCQPSSGVAEALAWGAGVYGAIRWRRSLAAWRNPVGACFGLGVLWALLSAAWSPVPAGAFRDVVKSASLVFGVWGLPAVFAGPRRVRTAVVAGAGLVAVRLAAELVRLVRALGFGAALVRGARFQHPYLYNHPNVSCMMAALGALVFVACASGGVRGGWRRAGVAAGLAVDLAYLVVMASRGPQIVFAAALLAYPLLVVPGWKARLAALLAVAAAGTGLWLGAGRINPRMEETATMSGAHGRDVVWKYVAERLPEHPVRGFGFGKRTFERVAYHDPDRKPLRGAVEYPHAHSYWLMLAFQGGFAAVALWLAGWLSLAAGLVRALVRAGRGTEGIRRSVADRAWPAFFLAAVGMVLLYGVGDYPDNLIRDAQFALPALALAWAWPPKEVRAA